MCDRGEFETIEHDILHTKDYFHNYKFGYIEKATKQFFYERLREKNFTEDKVADILNKSKKQLVDVKRVSKDAEEIIKECSIKIYGLENDLKKNQGILEERQKRTSELECEIQRLEEKSQNALRQNTLNKELKDGYDELQILVSKIENKKQALLKSDCKGLKCEVDALKAQQEKLVAREKRWSKVMLESNIDDLYFWYTKGVKLLEKLVGYKIKSYKTKGNRMTIRFGIRDLEIDVFVEDGNFVNAEICDGVEVHSLSKIKEHAIRTDDVRFLLFCLLFDIEK